ncbi:MAG: helix-turn-helix transcriptional regulator [Candidatus Sulfotelmatobacter sp.]
MGLGVATTSSAQAQTFIPLSNVIGARSASRKSSSGAATKPAYSVPSEGGIPGSPDSQNRAALLTTRGQEAGPAVDEMVLCKLYGLTRAEAGLAAHLLQGKSIEEAAAELVISHHTARTHLKRIFMKTDTHRQVEPDTRVLTAGL